MNINKILIILLAICLYSCADYQTQKSDQKHYYSSSGFVLVYEEDLFNQKIINKKINNDEFVVLHNLLKRNTPIKIINPKNSKTLETKVQNYMVESDGAGSKFINLRQADVYKIDRVNLLSDSSDIKLLNNLISLS